MENLHPVWQALLAACFTWFMTVLGAASVFLAREVSRRVLDGMLGFAARVMMAASFWSLLAPAITMSEGQGLPSWLPALGFAAGAMIFVVVEEVIPESQRNGHTDIATLGAMTGFAVMMVLGVSFS